MTTEYVACRREQQEQNAVGGPSAPQEAPTSKPSAPHGVDHWRGGPSRRGARSGSGVVVLKLKEAPCIHTTLYLRLTLHTTKN